MALMVTSEELYREACTALGAAIVETRLLTAELERRDAAAGIVVPDDVVNVDQPVLPDEPTTEPENL